jgi:prolyl 4-hydroxylase
MTHLTPALREVLAWGGGLHWTVPSLFTPTECAALIARIDAAGPTLAPVTTSGGPVVRTDIRTNERVMFDDLELADELFRRVRPHVPERMVARRAAGVNERLRGYRYREGQAFKPHYDGSYRASRDLESELTLLVYLNDDFEGGETRFLASDEAVRPRTGAVLLFAHRVLHEGAAVTRGTKYVLRSDVMYGDST